MHLEKARPIETDSDASSLNTTEVLQALSRSKVLDSSESDPNLPNHLSDNTLLTLTAVCTTTTSLHEELESPVIIGILYLLNES